MKTFLLLLTKSPKARNFCFSLCFMSFFRFFFVFVFCPIEITTANLTHSNIQKILNQVTLSNKHMNHLFWVKGSLDHYHINSYFSLFIFYWPKEGYTSLIAHRHRHFRYGILKNKKFDVKKLLPKISAEFTIVIT